MSCNKIVQKPFLVPCQLSGSQVSKTSSGNRRTRGLHLTIVNSSKINFRGDQDIFDELNQAEINPVELNRFHLNRVELPNIHCSDPSNPQVYQNRGSIFYSDESGRRRLPEVVPASSDYKSVQSYKNRHFCDFRQNIYLREQEQICNSCLNHQFLCILGQCSSVCVEQKAMLLLQNQYMIEGILSYIEMNEEEWKNFFYQSTGSTVEKRPPPSDDSEQVLQQKKNPVKKQKTSKNKCYCKLKGCSQNHCTCKKANLKCSSECECGDECHNWEEAPECRGCEVCAKPQTKYTSRIKTKGFNVNIDTSVEAPKMITQIFQYLKSNCTNSQNIQEESLSQIIVEATDTKNRINNSQQKRQDYGRQKSDLMKEENQSVRSLKCQSVDFRLPKYQSMDLE